MLLDTSALVEHLVGTKKGERVMGLLLEEPCYISEITLPELAMWCYRENHDVDEYFNKTREIVGVIPLDDEIYKTGSKITFETKKHDKTFGLMDGLILASGRRAGQKILSIDPHFKHFEDAETL